MYKYTKPLAFLHKYTKGKSFKTLRLKHYFCFFLSVFLVMVGGARWVLEDGARRPLSYYSLRYCY